MPNLNKTTQNLKWYIFLRQLSCSNAWKWMLSFLASMKSIVLLNWFFQNQGSLKFFLRDLFYSPSSCLENVDGLSMGKFSSSVYCLKEHERDGWLALRPSDGLPWTYRYWGEGIGLALPFFTATSLDGLSCLEHIFNQHFFPFSPAGLGCRQQARGPIIGPQLVSLSLYTWPTNWSHFLSSLKPNNFKQCGPIYFDAFPSSLSLA